MQIKWKSWLTNKYLIASLAFVLLLLLSDKNNVIDQYKMHQQYNKIKVEHAYYIHQIADAKRQYNELFTNNKNLEKFAREKYLMKRDDEDVFVIVNTKEDQENNDK